MKQSVTDMFVEQPLALPGSANYTINLCRFCGYSFEREIVIADTPLLDQDGRDGNREQPVMDIPQAEKDL